MLASSEYPGRQTEGSLERPSASVIFESQAPGDYAITSLTD